MKRHYTIIYLISLFLAAAGAVADEGALYAEEAPPGSAFIRVFNASSEVPLGEAGAGGKVFHTVAPLSASPYAYLPPGSHALKIGEQQQQLDMKAGEFYTAVVSEDNKVTLIEDTAFENRRKALVSFYNLMPDKTLDLKTADSQVPVVEDVDFLGKKEREVNPVKITLAATADDEMLGTADTVNLRRGRVFSLFACGEAASPKLVWVESKVDTTL